ncbi:MAG: hypothetical protein NZ521_05270, partial [Flammeovirgaceae bacterium]|nr:hypothetical protein [Flammeovirgaceae bacterium]MDW8287648.1 hypothetical protein [Flammeovirgaceae bacterium]
MKKWMLLLGVWISFLSEIVAQDSLAFRKDKNVILNDSLLNSFYEKLSWLEKEEKGVVHIVHIGDSHIQADFFTERVREMFCEENKFPLAARGFVFPYKAAQSNNPLNYQIRTVGLWKGFRSVISHHQSRWGLAGITATTYDSTAELNLTLLSTKTCPTPFDKVHLFYQQDSLSYEPCFRLENDSLLFPVRVENGVAIFQFPHERENLRLIFRKKNATQQQFVLQGFLFTNTQRPGVVYSASGANGAEFGTYFRCQDFFSQLRQNEPSLVIVSLGTNDAHHLSFDSLTFATNVRTFVTRLKEELEGVPILLTTPNDSKRKR